ncbi:MAG TPA: cupredoxin domain-containing protein [Terriglobales bacterium]|nr:cupredoxin domain-containing protein [Terriglobales bacterium]
MYTIKVRNQKRTMLVIVAVHLLLAGAVLMLTVVPAVRAEDSPRVIDITAKRFSFTPNQITLKKGETVKLRLRSEDVTHGFFSKPLKIDELIPAGQTTEITLTPQVAGSFTTICDHFCGSGHGNMNMTIVVE